MHTNISSRVGGLVCLLSDNITNQETSGGLEGKDLVEKSLYFFLKPMQPIVCG